MIGAAERRRYPRLAAPVIYRPAGLRLFHHRRSTAGDIGAGGMRVYSDEGLHLGERLELELLLPDHRWIRVWVRVVWVTPADGVEANYELGLQFTDIADQDRQRLASVLADEAG